MTPDLRVVRRKLAALRTVVQGNMFRNQWLALCLLDGITGALDGELQPTPARPTDEEIQENYLNATDPYPNVIPFPTGPSDMTRDLMLPEPA